MKLLGWAREWEISPKRFPQWIPLRELKVKDQMYLQVNLRWNLLSTSELRANTNRNPVAGVITTIKIGARIAVVVAQRAKHIVHELV